MKIFLLSFLLSLAFCTKSKAQTPTVSTNDLAKYIGQNITVCDSVYAVKALDNITFLNFGGSFPKAPLTLIVFKSSLSKFPQEPAVLYNNRRLCVTGNLTEFKDKLQIVINGPTQVIVENK